MLQNADREREKKTEKVSEILLALCIALKNEQEKF